MGYTVCQPLCYLIMHNLLLVTTFVFYPSSFKTDRATCLQNDLKAMIADHVHRILDPRKIKNVNTCYVFIKYSTIQRPPLLVGFTIRYTFMFD